MKIRVGSYVKLSSNPTPVTSKLTVVGNVVTLHKPHFPQEKKEVHVHLDEGVRTK